MRGVYQHLSPLGQAFLLWSLALLLVGSFPTSRAAAQGASAEVTNQWTSLNPAAPKGVLPSTRSSHTLVWDDGRGQMILFGGVSFSPYALLSDVWIYQPIANSWTHPLVHGFVPQGRQYHTAVWDTLRRQMLVFGGNLTGHNDAVNDLWSYRPDSSTWTQLHPSGAPPPARANHSAVWDTTNQQMLVFGGTPAPFETKKGQPTFSDLWAYRPTSNSWLQFHPKGPSPSCRYGHAAIWDSVGQQMLVFGGVTVEGANSRRLNDLWSYRPRSNRWHQLQPQVALPAPRAFSGAAFDTVNRQLLVFGGVGRTATALPLFNDLFAYNLAKNRWTALPNGALPTEPHESPIAWDTVQGRILLFGGVGDSSRAGDNSRPQFNDTWGYLLRR